VTILFGTAEYFEREFLTYAARNNLNQMNNDQILMIYSRLKNELLNDFVCEESIRKECIQNLERACFMTRSLELSVLAE
jgi:hypothetical protein